MSDYVFGKPCFRSKMRSGLRIRTIVPNRNRDAISIVPIRNRDALPEKNVFSFN